MQPSKRGLERNVVDDVPSQHRLMPLVVLRHGLGVIGLLEQMRIAPGVAEIVFRAGAEGGGELLAVNEELLVAFAPPAAARIPDVQHHAAEPALGLACGA